MCVIITRISFICKNITNFIIKTKNELYKIYKCILIINTNLFLKYIIIETLFKY